MIGDEWRHPDGQIKGTKHKLSMKSATKEKQCKTKENKLFHYKIVAQICKV